MNSRIGGYILKTVDYKDNDCLVSVFTSDEGLTTVKATSIKKINSKNNFSVLPYAKVEMEVNIGNKNYKTLQTVSVINSNRKLREDLSKQCYCTLVSELVEKTFIDQDSVEFYDLIDTTFSYMNDKNEVLSYALFLSALTNLLGVGAYVDGCVSCDNQQIIGISLSQGGFVCSDCKENDCIFGSLEELSAFRLINKARFEHYDLIKVSNSSLLFVIKILESFINEYCGVSIVSRKVVDKLLLL